MAEEARNCVRGLKIASWHVEPCSIPKVHHNRSMTFYLELHKTQVLSSTKPRFFTPNCCTPIKNKKKQPSSLNAVARVPYLFQNLEPALCRLSGVGSGLRCLTTCAVQILWMSLSPLKFNANSLTQTTLHTLSLHSPLRGGHSIPSMHVILENKCFLFNGELL